MENLLNTHSSKTSRHEENKEEHKQRIRKNQVVLGFKNFLCERPPEATPIESGNDLFRLRKLGYQSAQHYYETEELILEGQYISHEIMGHTIPDMCQTLDNRRDKSHSAHDKTYART